MGRIQPNPPDAASTGPKKKAAPPRPKTAAKRPEAPAQPASNKHPLARRRALAVAVLGVVAMLTIGAGAIWRRVAPLVASNQRYLLDAQAIVVSDLPEWIIGDVRTQIISSGGLAGRVSILDPDFATVVQSAFALHPWVASVDRIEKRPPQGVAVTLSYRRPVAVIETPLGQSKQLLPVDAEGIHLPAGDVPPIRLSYLPRITGVVGQPTTGQRWDDPRVAGAVDLAARLAGDWESLGLKDIIPSARPEVLGDRTYFVYDLMTRGGTRVVWGAPPREGVPGEAEFAVKLARLKQCVAQYAALDWTDWPAVVDIRRGIEITPRTAKKPPAPGTGPVVAEKPQVVAEKPTRPQEAQTPMVK
ncbi:MAG TPA: hypothetical protein VEQ85_11655 [Lacipirellulaceae bacterium]|nr:hypothetical protein [Lacipirellulaceae bacterium]